MTIHIHYQDDTRDHERDYGKWSGLLLNVSNAPKPALRLRTVAGVVASHQFGGNTEDRLSPGRTAKEAMVKIFCASIA